MPLYCPTPVPVILDTDIGTDIDDTWALALLLHSPELDLRLITTSSGDTGYRAALAARMLEVAGRTDIPIGVGRSWGEYPCHQAAWLADFAMAHYPGPVLPDAVDALVTTVMDSTDPVTIIGIGPMTNLAEAVRREPRIARHARLVVMAGSIARNFDNAAGGIAEWNIVQDIPAAQQVFAAPWSITLTPLDSCGCVRLNGETFRRLEADGTPLMRAVAENYRLWLAAQGVTEEGDGWFAGQPTRQTSILYDTVAVYLAHADDFLHMDTLRLRVTDEGCTLPDPDGAPVRCALGWRDLDGFYAHLTTRLYDTHDNDRPRTPVGHAESSTG